LKGVRMKVLLLLLLMGQAAAQHRGLFPAILNLASNAVISSNATCGDPEPEVYCKLVEHVPGRRIKNPHCLKCDANSVLSRERHPITNAIDGTNRWWQSPSIKNGQQFHWITITLDLKQVFQIAYIIIKAANSPRAGNWILERSLDGVSFEPWQFYAISDSECLYRYNITPRLGPPTYKRDTEVICTSYYSRLNPLEHGEIHTSLINGRPGADDLTSDLLNFTSARYIRLRLQRIRTLNADLMTLSARDPRDIDPIVTRRYYYSIKDISVGGMCICYGHAQSCPLDPVSKLHSVCDLHTSGVSCNECCPGYHQQPWQPGTISDGNTCEKCNCHNKADDCYYNQTISELSLSLNTHGVRQGGGVCFNCQQNTAGINCETCKDGYFRPAEVSPYSDFPCVECKCDLRGSKSSVCARDNTQPGLLAGQCMCKEGFAGQQCDRCAFGYRDFPQCFRCECSLSGSINTDPCSPCICKENVMGAHCDLCKPGFFNLQESNPLGCTSCFCFGVSDVCESSGLSIGQVVTTEALLFPSETITTTPVLHSNEIPIHSNISSGATHQQMLWWAAPQSFLGNKLLSYGGFLNYFVVYDAPLDFENPTLSAHCDIIIKGNGLALRLSRLLPLSLSTLAEQLVNVPMVWQQFAYDQTGRHVTRDDLLLVLADVTSLVVRVYLNTSATGTIRLSSVSLDIGDASSHSEVQALAVERCECPWGYSGTSCESCLPGFYRVGGILFGGNCMQCECNDHAAECDINGVCVGCTHNTTGPHCDQCLLGFYGDATEGTTDDCQLCPCPLTKPSNRFSPTCVLDASGKVLCDQCQDGYTGTNCEKCASGFYGNPQVVGGTCVRCECNGNVDISEAGHCDTVSGECLRCLGNTAGRHCELCRPGYYGDAVGHGCMPCGCNKSGSLFESCDKEGQCQCVEGVTGHKCDRCSRGYYATSLHADLLTFLSLIDCYFLLPACSCDHTGGNCNPENGGCICPAHTEGETCNKCVKNYWGHNPTTGCKLCSCSEAGSSSPHCDLTNGQCLCKEGFFGKSCDQCAAGYYGYPACSACGCDMAGTEETFCNATLGVCSCQNTGNCVCKPGVSGRRCEECVSGWFGLSAENLDGCLQCFCSGLSQDCEEQGGLTRVPVYLAYSSTLPFLSLVSQSNLQGTVSGVHRQGSEMLLDTRQLNTSGLTGPLYWRLPAQFEGNQLLSYGGLLSYTVTFYAEDGSGLSNQEPQVLMRGGTLRKLAIYTDMVAPSNGVTTQHDIRLTEHKWKYFNSVSQRSVSHADFMSILSNIEYIIIKASYGTRLQQSRISNITMEMAVEVEKSEVGNVARLIESCVCPPGYTGLSCQDCDVGYFRQPQSELSPQSKKSMFVRPCVRCRCNNHSEKCDAETGQCQDCKHHTSGQSCEKCASGYYGSVKGSIGDCSPCACPLLNNSFSPTCILEGAAGDFRCTACQPGYEGRYCERCSVGYYGNPSVPGGVCSQCSCSAWGSLHLLCDVLTGECECKDGVKGQSCNECEKRSIFQEGECVSCDDKCTGILLDDLDELHNHFLFFNLSTIAMSSYRQLWLLENQTREMQVQKCALLLEGITRLQNNIQVLQREAAHLNQTAEEGLGSANQTHLLEDVESILNSIKDVNLTAAELIDFLSSRVATSDKLGRLSTSLTADIKTLQHANTTLNDAVQHNIETNVLLDTAHTLLQLYQQVEMLAAELDQWRPLLRKQVNGLVMGLKKNDALENVYRAEKHAHLLQSYALSLHSHVWTELLLLDETFSSLFYLDLQLNVSMVTIRLGLVRDSVHNSSLLLRQPVKALQSLSNGSSEALQQTQIQAAAAHSKLQEAMQRLQKLRAQLKDSSSLVENANNTLRETSQLMTLTHTAGLSLRFYEAEYRTQHLMDRIKPMRMLGETLSRNLSDIRELIYQARRQAASIKVALQADRGCVRSYRPSIQSSNFNTLNLIVKTTTPNNLLFYLGSNTTMDFLAAEMHNGQVSLLWDVGSGSTRLEFPGLDITNNRWTKINATRFGSHVALSVHQLDSESALLPAVTTTSPGTFQVLDIDENSFVYIAGLGRPAALRSTTFQGCLGEVSLNEQNIGLWNYDHTEGECGGCFSSPQAEETSFHFDGSGYSVVQKSLRSTSTLIVLQFKTLSPVGLLLYLASNNTRDFLSMELVEGRIRLTFDLGSGALMLTSNRKYNTGVWYKITLQRNKRKGYLSIMAADQSSEKEVLEADSPGKASDLNRSDLDPIFIGGFPASRPIRRQVASRSYVGCIKNVEIARSNFDLLRDAHGVRKGCILKAVRSVSLLAGGYVQITPPSFGQEAELLFSFSSNNQSGVLLAAFSNDRSHKQYFLSVHLVSGALEVELGEVGGATRKVTVIKPDGGSFSDRMKHSVIITINKKSLSVQIDEEHKKLVSLLPGVFSRLSPASLFIGGLPSADDARLPIRLQKISRLLVDLSGALRYEGVKFDKCVLEEKLGDVLLPDDQDVNVTPDPTHLPLPQPTQFGALSPEGLTCASDGELTFVPSAVQFGLSRNSHMTFIINPSTVRKSVSVRLLVRSWALDGLILLLSDSKQMDFVVLSLKGGRLMMSADLGKGPASITSSVAVNNGEWHAVVAEVGRRLMSVSVNSLKTESISVKGNQLDVDNKVFLGGTPHTMTSRRIGDTSSFPGCVRSISLNGVVLDVSKPASQHGVTSCFTRDQIGSYFNGSGYAEMIHDGYKVGSDMTVSLEFQTSQSEGVLLGISSAKVDAVGLEMINGQVVFNVNNGAGRVSVRSGGQMLCDGQWHRLLAQKTKHALSLTVDERTYTTANPYPQSTSAETNNPVFLGGYPAGVKQNCLSLSSSFRGCLRNLQLLKSHLTKTLDLSSAHFLLGVTPNSCPAS
uniref:Laminin, alpha 1 n=1 Tax=Haplochromis burtoni TaxID=8153 RepID=A0A3Q2V502_HAPBU